MTTPPPGDLARQVLTLAAELAEVDRRLRELGEPATLRAQVTGLKRQVAAIAGADSGGISGLVAALGTLADRMTAIEDMLSQRGRSEVWDLTSLPGALEGETRDQAWQQLTSWVRDVLGGIYHLTAGPGPAPVVPPQGGPKLPPCWPEHPDLVVELAWLAQEWIQIYRTPYGTPARAATWHASLLPGLRQRITRTTAARCTRGEHVAPDSPGSLRLV